ncbi:MAG: M12 family metallopeptidase [Ketobacteraceae bacterium]|nr:M12 family metallopeptidase [Ketobacteraceae bacterium]
MKVRNILIHSGVALTAVIAANSAFALAAQQLEKDKYYHFTNRWAYGCVPYTMSTGAEKYKSFIEKAAAEWNNKVPNIAIYPLENAAELAPPRCQGVTKSLSITEIPGGSCNVENTGSHGSWFDSSKRDSRVMQLTSVIEMGCLRDERSDTAKLRSVTHEFGHALGFVHEHQRIDAKARNAGDSSYIELQKDNVIPIPLVEDTAELKSEKQNAILLTEYDYYSIMHYSPRAQGKIVDDERLVTLKPVHPDGPTTEELENYMRGTAEITQLDADAANAFYASGKSDIGVEIKKDGGCSATRHSRNDCESGQQANQLDVSLITRNHGPYDSGTVQVEYVLPAAAKSASVESTDFDNCFVQNKSVICQVANMMPITDLKTTLKVLVDNEDKHNYQLKVNNVDAIDDLEFNNAQTLALDTKGGSLGFFGLLAIGMAGMMRRMKK